MWLPENGFESRPPDLTIATVTARVAPIRLSLTLSLAYTSEPGAEWTLYPNRLPSQLSSNSDAYGLLPRVVRRS